MRARVAVAAKDGEAPRATADRGLALIRVTALPVVLVAELVVDSPDETRGPFLAVYAATAVYAAVTLGVSLSPARRGIAPATYVGLDLLAIAALSLASGGETSEVRRAFFLPPVAAAFLLRPLTGVTAAVAVGAYVGVSLVDPPVGRFSDSEFVVAQSAYLAWFGAAAVILSHALGARAERIAELAAERGRLVADAIEAEERERRRVADALHEGTVQDLLAARLDLGEARRGDRDALDRVEQELDGALRQLRESVADLHPVALRQAGLAPALESIARRSERRGGFRTTIHVDPAATGCCDDLLLSLTRELLANAAKHAGASHVSVTLERRGDDLRLEVADDGRGMQPDRPRAALREGHSGLASAAERVKALSGRFEVSSEPGRGTLARATIPVAAAGTSAPG